MTTKTNFQLVTEVNYVAGKTNQTTWQAAEQQAKVISGEYDEVIEAVAMRRLDKLRDGIADLLVTAYGMGSVLGYNVDMDMVAVTQSLFTRFDRTPEDAVRTKEKYDKMGIDTNVRATHIGTDIYYVTISSKDQINVETGEAVPEGKFLKSWQYSEPQLPKLDADKFVALSEGTCNMDLMVYRPYHKVYIR